jgi:hypothetical protein
MYLQHNKKGEKKRYGFTEQKYSSEKNHRDQQIYHEDLLQPT